MNTITGTTTSEDIQSRTDARVAEIRRAGRYVPVMSNEEWNRRQKEARGIAEEQLRKEREGRERIENEYARAVLRQKASEESHTRARRDQQFPGEIEKKLRTYHELPDETIPEKEWYPVYKETAPFLAKCIVAYRYGNDKAKGRTEGDQGDFWGRSLVGYFSLRDIEADGDEGGFENLVSQKVQNCPSPAKGKNLMLILSDVPAFVSPVPHRCFDR
jgi:hypothetical protein